MKNLFKNTAISLFLGLFTAQAVNAAVLDSKIIVNKIKKDVSQQFSGSVKGKLVTNIVNMPYKSIVIPDGKLEINTIVNSNYFSSFTIVKVNILVNGKTVKSFGVPVKLAVINKVWVAKTSIDNGEELNLKNIILEDKEVGLLAENAAGEDFSPVNMRTKRVYKSGEIIDKRFNYEEPCVVKNSIVSVVFQNDDFVLTVSGEALENGKMGDFIKVRNKQYKKDYTGKIVGINKILVDI